MKLILISLLLLSTAAQADERTAVSKLDKNVTFTVTDNPCTFFPALPDGAPLKEARAHDANKNISLVGCSLNYGSETELQLVNEAEKKHYRFMIPTKDFI